MRIITDPHIHSHYSRACSRELTPENLATWGKRKGIELIATGDFVHPGWRKELASTLKEEDGGFLVHHAHPEIKFFLSVELSVIYSEGGATRRLHIVIAMPDMATAERLAKALADRGMNITADGRPILGMTAHDLAALALETSAKAMIIPAHIWTPWFALYGSKSGYNSITECFRDLTPHITAVETGLSSDPPMNWRIAELDGIRIVSSSDAHSCENLGREATVLELEHMDYASLFAALKKPNEKNHIIETIEFYPEEGKYHYDGHRDCAVRLTPKETQKQKGICKVCGKPLTVGVLARVEELADRPEGYKDADRPEYKTLIPLQEIIANSLGLRKQSKKVQAEYMALTDQKNEFDLLVYAPEDEVKAIANPLIAEGIRKMRAGEVHIAPGYDGVFGTIELFTEEERKGAVQPRLL
ncbi:MAG: endonuclease Q family protein [Patescibacteria group bacterium]|jgi:uncharacterized protein (TIGR00375 family)